MSVVDKIVINDINGVLMIHSPKGRYTEMRNREYYGLSFCKSGQRTYTLNGVKTVSDKYHAVILPQGGSYTLYGDETGVFPLINFSTLSPFTDSFISIRLENPETYIKEVENLSNYPSAKSFSVLYKLLDRLGDEDKQGDSLSHVIKFMEKNIGRNDISNGELAALLNISEVYFRRLFKSEYGCSPSQYILSVRLKNAKTYLSYPFLTVEECAAKSGFSSVQYFCRVFKKELGVTPSKYRKRV